MLRTASAQRASLVSWKRCSGFGPTGPTKWLAHRGNLLLLAALGVFFHWGAATSPSPWPISAGDASTLRQVVLVHRHGARFPTKPTGKADIAWPIRTQFWESYKGHLTPVGCSQVQDIGSALRQRYIHDGLESLETHAFDNGKLFHGVDKVDGTTLAVYTSNVQRTLQSAWSFLLGFVPRAAVFFAFRSERVFSDTARRAAGVPIYIEDAVRSDDRLFHEWRLDENYETWRKSNIRQSKRLLHLASQSNYQELLDKLFECTREERLSPSQSMMDRLIAAKDVDTQVAIEEAHNRPVLVNEKGILLNKAEREMLQEIGNEVKRRWYGAASGLRRESYGQKGAGYLAHKIWRHMQQRAEGKSNLRFVQMSCHDTTLAALATHLGLELPTIGFGAFLAFELHHQGKRDEFVVKTFYNSNPTKGTSYALKSLVLPLGEERLVNVKDCASGAVTLSEFSAHCEIPGVEETFQSFLSLCSISSTKPTRRALRDLFEKGASGGLKWISLKKWRERYSSAFQCFDSDNDGRLSCNEVQSALAEWGYSTSRETLQTLFRLLDADPESGEFDEEDLHLTMSALVGIRGGLHGQSVQLESQ